MENLIYYLSVAEFIKSFIEIPTNPVTPNHTSTNKSSYLAGIADLYSPEHPNQSVGRCSASFLCINNGEFKNGKNVIYSDISNYISLDNGLIVSWFTPTTLVDLELDSMVHSMVTECIVNAVTKIGQNPFYGEQFNLVVSSKQNSSGEHQIWFEFTKI